MMYFIISLLLILSLLFFKSRLIQLILIFMLYPILTLATINITGATSRIVAAVGESYYSEHLSHAFYCQVIFYFFMFIALLSVRKSVFSCERLPVDNAIRWIFLFALLICFPIAYPAIFGLGQGRFGSGGSLILIFNALIILSRKQEISLVDYIAIGINLFALVSGERADTILTLFLYYILIFKDGMIVERNIGNAKLFIILFFILIIGLLSGINRVGGELTMEYFYYYLFNQGTVVDVIHVYMSSFWYVDKIGYNLWPVVNFIFSFIPFTAYGGASSPYNVTYLLRDFIPNVGGGLFYTAGYVVYGIMGGSIFSLFYGLFLKFTFHGNKVLNLIFISLFLQQLRLQWYGLTYMGNVVTFGILIASIIYLTQKYLSKN